MQQRVPEASLLAAARRRRAVEIARARRHPADFIRYVFGIELEPIQLAWIDFWMRHPKTVLHGAVGLGKSMLVRGFILWLIGADPSMQVIWLGATQRQPKKSLRAIASLIERDSPDSKLHQVFPDLHPGKLWRSVEIEIDREADPQNSEPTIAAFGAYSEGVLGSRAFVLVIDDLCNFTNTLTEDGRSKMIEWLGSVLSRLTADDVRVIVLGNVWHESDATADLVRNKGFAYMRTPAYTEDEDGTRTPTAPRALSLKRIAELEIELGAIQAARMLACKLAGSDAGRFKREAFALALRAGETLQFRPARARGTIVTGIDLGHTKKTGSDRTAMVTFRLRPDLRKEIIDVRSGKWSSREIVENILDLRARYDTRLGVESNGGQRLLMEYASDIYAFAITEKHTGTNKYDRATGIEALADEVARGYWVFPAPPSPVLHGHAGLVEPDGTEDDFASMGWTVGAGAPHPEIQGLINDAMAYDPTKHPGDRLMAWWIAARTFADSDAAYLVAIEGAGEVPDLDLFAAVLPSERG